MAVLWACSINNGVWLPFVCRKERAIDLVVEPVFDHFSYELTKECVCV